MRLTKRDISVVRDVALSHVLSRDQLIELGYFSSVTRVNTRLRQLIDVGLIARLDTPFFQQSLYRATKAAAEVVGERIAPLIEGRSASPKFVVHALQTTTIRIALTKKFNAAWRFEQQLWRKVCANGPEVRPDGLIVSAPPIFIEVDLGHASFPRVKEKIASYQALADSGRCEELYGFSDFRLLAITTGPLRAQHLRRAIPANARFDCLIQTFADLAITQISPWS
jgi:hypothetical protein